MKGKFVRAMAVALCCAMLAGCGTPGQDSTSASPGAEQNTTVGAAEGYTYKIATVRWNDTWPTDFLTDGVMGDLAKEADIDIEWQIYYSNDFGEQKALLFASDDLPDAFFGSCGLGDTRLLRGCYVHYYAALQHLGQLLVQVILYAHVVQTPLLFGV